jgi:hypothetical protein
MSTFFANSQENCFYLPLFGKNSSMNVRGRL